MIAKPLEAIETSDIDQLVTDKVAESRTLDYKEKLPGQSDSEKKEFLADITSFANASGGDLVFGVAEERDAQNRPTGIPKQITGLGMINVDAEKLRLEAIIRDGVEPRVPGVQIQAINGSTTGSVLIIRVRQSWNPPHMVKGSGAGSYRFYSRNSAGKYPLDSTEIRAAFALSEALPERIRRFRDERLARVAADETPVLLQDNPKLVLQVVPLAAFGSSAASVDMGAVSQLGRQGHLKHISNSASIHRFNLDGYVSVVQYTEGPSDAYLQVFRNGCIEAVDARMIRRSNDNRTIPSQSLERGVIEAVQGYLDLLRKLDIDPPILVMLSLMGIKGFSMANPGPFWPGDSDRVSIDRDVLLLPELLVDEHSEQIQDTARLLRSLFDTLWQASGRGGSPNYDREGNWAPKRNS